MELSVLRAAIELSMKRQARYWSRSRRGLFCGLALTERDVRTGSVVSSLSWHSPSLAVLKRIRW